MTLQRPHMAWLKCGWPCTLKLVPFVDVNVARWMVPRRFKESVIAMCFSSYDPTQIPSNPQHRRSNRHPRAAAGRASRRGDERVVAATVGYRV